MLYLTHQLQAFSCGTQRGVPLVQSLDNSDATFSRQFGIERCLHFVFCHGVQSPVQ